MFDSWDVKTLREADEYNRANPDPQFAEMEQRIRELLAQAESQPLHRTATPIADTHNVPMRDRRPSSGASNYSRPVEGPTGAQQSFIRSLCAERGVDADALLATIKTRSKASREIDRLKKLPRQEQVRPATERQMEFLQDLLTEREHNYTVGTNVSFADASAMITALQNAPRITGTKASHGIRHGRYAYQPAEAQAQFYRVAQDGRIYIQAGPTEHPYRGTLNEALEAIKVDPKIHAALYGTLIGRCGRCSLPLTDENSRAVGLGPICADKSDW